MMTKFKMAAFRSHMCLLPRIRLLCKLDTLKGIHTCRNLSFVYIGQSSIFRLKGSQHSFQYSTEKPPNSLKDITGDILKSKIAEKEDEKSKQEQEKTDKKEKQSKWSGKNAWRLGLLLLGGWGICATGGMLYVWGSPNLDPGGNPIADEYSELPTIEAYFRRAKKEFNMYKQVDRSISLGIPLTPVDYGDLDHIFKLIRDPSRDKLLPDPLEYPYIQPPYTLVIEMNGIFVHPNWTYGTGWRFQKNPSVDYFLQTIGPPMFEVVIYTAEQGYNADPILNILDPNGYIWFRLYRDATRYSDSHHIKDLSCLNRDLSKVIMVDWNKKSFKLQPRNGLKFIKWTGNDADKSLADLANFLRAIASSGVDDVRTVLEYYSNFDDPLEAFRENQRKLQEQQEKQIQDVQHHEKKRSSFLLPSFSKR